MMQTFIPFLQIFLLLLIGGTALALVLLPEATLGLLISLALPLSAFLSAILVLLYTAANIPLSFATLLIGHLLVIAGLIFCIYKRSSVLMDLERPSSTPKISRSNIEKFILAASAILIASVGIYSFSHAVLLPTAQFDSLTNWTMRSKISFDDKHMAFDPTEVRGMAKPQYPFLLHSLQITSNQGQPAWSDTAANAMPYLLSVTSFAALFLMIRKLRGTVQSAVATMSIIMIPLLSMHLAQGYGDISLLQYLLLSLACLGMWMDSTHARKNRWLVLSGIFVVASVWTKSEGLVFGLAPWCLTVALLCGKNRASWKAASPAIIVALALSVPWPIFAWLKGLSLTPHSSDTIVQLHPEALTEAILGLFGRGSFGITWYALALLVPTVLIAGWKRHANIERSLLPLLAWGSVMFVEICVIYLATPNVRFLLNGESYYRQMMLPAAMLILALSVALKAPKKAY